MRHYIFIKKPTKLENIKIYGSIKALLENEDIRNNGHPISYNRMMYLLINGHSLNTKKFIIKRCDVITIKNKL